MIRARRFVLPALAVFGWAASARLFAEDLDPSKLFDSAKQHCAEKRYGKCLADLQLLIGEVGRLRIDTMKAYFPAAPPDWKAGEAEAISSGGLAMFGAGSQVKRKYTSGAGKRAEITLMTDAGAMMQMVTLGLQNPAYLGDGKRIVTIKGRKALLDWKTDATRGSLMVVLNVPASMVQIEANGITSSEVQELIAGAIDFDALEKGIQN